MYYYSCFVVVAVPLFSCVQLFGTPWIVACQASLSFTSSLSFLKLKSIELVMSSNYLLLCCPFLLLPSIFPSIRVSPNELAFCIRWPKSIDTVLLVRKTSFWICTVWSKGERTILFFVNISYILSHSGRGFHDTVMFSHSMSHPAGSSKLK